MARAIWTGSLSFGLVNVPVGLYSATEDHAIHFNQFESGTSDRVRNRRVNERTGEEVEWSKVVKGHDLGGGEYVIVTDEELEAVAPGPSRTIDITDFVEQTEIDPIYYEKSYYLAPHTDAARHAYGLLHQAMLDAGRVGVATFVMRGKQYLVAIRPQRDVIGLETMHFADEVRDPVQDIDGLPVAEEFSPRELDIAKMLVESMTTTWEPERYEDTYRQRVMELIDRKRSGEVVTLERAAPPAPVVDLMDALRASVEAARARSGRAAAEAPTQLEEGATSSRANKTPSRSRTRPPVEPDLQTMGKSELLARAAELNVAGRSKMTRDQLITAIGEAGGKPAAKAPRAAASRRAS